MSNSEDPPRSITAASHEVRCSVTWLRTCVRRGQIEAERLPHGHLIFRNKGIRQAKKLLYGTAATKPSKKKNGR